METVEVEFGGPPWRTFGSMEEAIAAPPGPRQGHAKRDSGLIAGATINSGQFSESECLLQFSNGKHLLARAFEFCVHWRVSDGDAPPVPVVPPRRLLFPSRDEPCDFDPNAMLCTITGRELRMILACEQCLLIYPKGTDIFWLSAYRNAKTRGDLLHVHWET